MSSMCKMGLRNSLAVGAGWWWQAAETLEGTGYLHYCWDRIPSKSSPR